MLNENVYFSDFRNDQILTAAVLKLKLTITYPNKKRYDVAKEDESSSEKLSVKRTMEQSY